MSETFEYVARGRGGEQVKGRMSARSADAVARRLQAGGQTVVSVGQVSTRGLSRDIALPGSNRVKPQDLTVAVRQLATMIEAGISLLRSLDILTEQTAQPGLRAALAECRQAVERGKPLSEGLGASPRVFPVLMINMVRAGETGGFLDRALVSVADTLEADAKLRSKVVSAMTYPLVVLGIALVACTAMLIFIVPTFEEMYAGLGAELPALTQGLVTLSGSLRVVLPFVVAPLVVLGVWWWGRFKNSRRVREVVDPLKLRMPVFGVLIQKVAVSRFCRNLAAMVGAGVPMLTALRVVGATSGSIVVERAADAVGESIRQGRSLTAPLEDHPVFPSMVRQMIAIGEESGSLETMLTKVHQFYDREVEAMTEALASLIEPLMIVGIGILVGGMVLALYMPMFSMFDAM